MYIWCKADCWLFTTNYNVLAFDITDVEESDVWLYAILKWGHLFTLGQLWKCPNVSFLQQFFLAELLSHRLRDIASYSCGNNPWCDSLCTRAAHDSQFLTEEHIAAMGSKQPVLHSLLIRKTRANSRAKLIQINFKIDNCECFAFPPQLQFIFH